MMLTIGLCALRALCRFASPLPRAWPEAEAPGTAAYPVSLAGRRKAVTSLSSPRQTLVSEHFILIVYLQQHLINHWYQIIDFRLRSKGFIPGTRQGGQSRRYSPSSWP